MIQCETLGTDVLRELLNSSYTKCHIIFCAVNGRQSSSQPTKHHEKCWSVISLRRYICTFHVEGDSELWDHIVE